MDFSSSAWICFCLELGYDTPTKYTNIGPQASATLDFPGINITSFSIALLSDLEFSASHHPTSPLPNETPSQIPQAFSSPHPPEQRS